MISNQIIQETIDDLYDITKVNFWVSDLNGIFVAATYANAEIEKEVVSSLLSSVADNIEVQNNHYFKVYDQKKPMFILAALNGSQDAYSMGKVAVAQLQRLIAAYKEKYDKNSFIQNLLMDNLLVVDIYNRAKQLKVDVNTRRIVYVVEVLQKKDNSAFETVKSLFAETSRHFVTEVDDQNIILVKGLEEDETLEEQLDTANMLVDMLNAEAMAKVRISYGTIVDDIKAVSKSYKEAKMALEVGRIFYPSKTIISYSTLGVGRLIYQLPMSLCDMFLEEIFGANLSEKIDEEAVNTVNQFFENNLNISETARQLFVHRNTLTYRLEKIEKATGLDIRNFDDAMAFKIAMMVGSYKKFLSEEKE